MMQSWWYTTRLPATGWLWFPLNVNHRSGIIRLGNLADVRGYWIRKKYPRNQVDLAKEKRR